MATPMQRLFSPPAGILRARQPSLLALPLTGTTLEEETEEDKQGGGGGEEGGDAPPGEGAGRHLPSNIWSTLPEDLLERVLACLPIASFLRLRRACKRWNSLSQASPNFLHLRSQLSPHSACLISIPRADVVPPREIGEATSSSPWNISPALRCLNSVRWEDVELPAETGEGTSRSPWRKLLAFIPNSYVLFSCKASDGGLLCCAWDSCPQRYVICNPVTRKWRDIPALPSRIIEANGPFVVFLVSFIVDRSDNRYRIVLVGKHGIEFFHNETDLATWVYDSVTQSWKSTGTWPPGATTPSSVFKTFTILRNSELVLLEGKKKGYLLIYDIEKEVWKRVETHAWPDTAAYPHLMEHKGNLLMVGALRSSSSMMIWKLEPTKLEWIEEREMPAEIRANVFRFSEKRAARSSSGDAALHASTDTLARVLPFPYKCFKSEDRIFYAYRNEVGVYNLSTRSWRWLPVCPFTNDWSAEYHSFEPRLEAVP